MKDDPKSKVRLVLVDDDLDLIHLMSIRLKREGFEVIVSHNGINLEEIIKIEHPEVILLDIQMQGIHGDDICKDLKSKNETRAIHVILISSKYDIKEIADKCGADSYYSKPVNFSRLANEIKNFMQA